MSRINRVVGNLVELANEMDEAGFVAQANRVDELARTIYAQDSGVDPAMLVQQQREQMEEQQRQIDEEQQQAEEEMQQNISEQEQQQGMQQDYFDRLKLQLEQAQQALQEMNPPQEAFQPT